MSVARNIPSSPTWMRTSSDWTRSENRTVAVGHQMSRTSSSTESADRRSSANRVQSRSHLSKVENSDDRMAQEMGTGADCVGFAVLKSGERSVGQSFHRQTQRTVEGALRFDSHCPKLVVPLLPIRTN
jgi:hypothetical protein